MTDAPSDPTATSARAAGRQMVAQRRDALRKAALKANMARRKAQVRGRAQAEMPADADTAAPSGIDPNTDTDTRNA